MNMTNNMNSGTIIEPCCFNKQLSGLLSDIENENEKVIKPEAAHFFTWGDLSLPEFLDFFTGITPECNVFLSLIHVDYTTLVAINRLMEKKTSNGGFIIKQFTLLSQGNDRADINKVLGKHKETGRFLSCETKISFRCLTVGNGKHHYVLNGSINQSPTFSMQMFSLTTSIKAYQEVMRVFNYHRQKRTT